MTLDKPDSDRPAIALDSTEIDQRDPPHDSRENSSGGSKGEHLPLPEGVPPVRVNWTYALGLAAIHLLCLLALVPWLFSWTGVVLVVAGHLTFGMLGINIGYHRLLTHQGFTCPRWLEYTLATLGVCCFQESPARWVAIHRMHHQFSDDQPDPHTPLVGFLWSHVGWLLVQNRDHGAFRNYERYVRDLLRQPFYWRLEQNYFWIWIYLLHAVLFFVVGLAIGWANSGRYLGGVQFGASLLVWGVFVRTVFVLHGTWSVNSVTHLWGYQNHDTRDNSRNNWLVAIFTHGEGWHNNHHAHQRSVTHGQRWWELDMSHWVICALETVGLARNVVRP
jgi:fatty-acid desaturase